MKFTKEELKETLKARLTANGKKLTVSDQTLTASVETLYAVGVNDETELEDFVSKVLPSFETLEGNYRKDQSDFIKDWKSKTPAPNPPQDSVKANEKPDRIELLLQEVEALKKEREEEKSAREVETKRSGILSKMKELGIKDGEWAKAYISKINVENDSDIDKEAQDALAFYNQSKAAFNPYITPGRAGGKAVEDEHIFDDVVARIKKNRDGYTQSQDSNN